MNDNEYFQDQNEYWSEMSYNKLQCKMSQRHRLAYEIDIRKNKKQDLVEKEQEEWYNGFE